MELGAPAQKDARLEMTQLRDVLYVLQLFEVTQFLAENATCPPPFFIASELPIIGKRQSGAF